MTTANYDIVVVGGGIAGYSAAIRLAQRGRKVALIEERFLGGECTNYGCVPSKALYRIAESIKGLKRFCRSPPTISWPDTVSWVKNIVDNLRNGIKYLVDRYGVELYTDHAIVTPKGVKLADSGEHLDSREIIVATGTIPRPLPQTPFDGRHVLSNREIFYLKQQPSSLVIVGGGAIGVEIAHIFALLGTEVYLVEAQPRILPMCDPDVSRAIKTHLSDLGVKIRTSTTVNKIEVRSRVEEAEVTLSTGDKLRAEKVLVAIGRTPRTEDLFQGVDVRLSKGFIEVGDGLRTSAPRIRAVGDVAGPPLLAHKALLEGLVAAESIASGKDLPRPEPKAIPFTIFSGLEVSFLGYTEEELRSMGVKYKRYRLPLGFLPSSMIKGGERSFVKILTREENPEEVLGIHMVAPNASEVISAFIPLYLRKLRLADVARIPYPHMTVSEALREVAEYILGEPIHVFARR